MCKSNGDDPETVTALTLDSMCTSANVVGLEKCVALEELSMIGCGITTLEGFPALPALRKLELNDNRISGGLEALAGITTLEELNLGGNRIASRDEIKAISALPLVNLDLVGCPCCEDSDEYRAEIFGMIPTLQVLDGVDAEGEEVLMESEGDDDEEEDDELDAEDDDEDDLDDEEDDEDDEDDEDEDDEDDEDEEDEEDEDDDGEVGTAALVGAPLDDDEGDFEADEEPESEDFDDDEDDEEDDEDAGAAKKQRVA